MTHPKRFTFGIVSLALAAGLGYALRAAASGIPSTSALAYAGVLEDAAGPINGEHNIQVILYDATAGNDLCQSTSTAINVIDGHFSVPLPNGCTTAAGANPNIWIDVLVDGSDTGRTKIGAVPYAVEANHAVNADNATNATNATNASNATNAANAANATNASVASALASNAVLGTATSGTVAASTTTTEAIVLQKNATYLLSVFLFGANTDVHQTYIVHSPGQPNLNVDFAPLLSSSFDLGSIQLATQSGAAPSSSYGLNSVSDNTLELTLTAGTAATSWTYSLARLL
jgi:hypothetical protein